MPNVTNPWWKDASDSEEIASALDDLADELKELATTRRQRSEIGRLRKAATELRQQHDIPAPPPPVRRATTAGE